MSNLSFVYIPSSVENSAEFKRLQRKHRKEMSSFSDSTYISEIFEHLSYVYYNLSLLEKKNLKVKKEEEITDYIRRKLQNNSDFGTSGFKVNTEARNQSITVGYYDLKFEHSHWNNYFTLECKPIDLTKTKVDHYIHKSNENKEDGGLYRFLINKYAENLPFGGMLGYIISDNPDKVIANLKNKIESFQLTEKNLSFGNLIDGKQLEISVANFQHSFQSDHIRSNINGQIIDPIHIFHLFFDLTNSEIENTARSK
jgi:hypothetical protein